MYLPSLMAILLRAMPFVAYSLVFIHNIISDQKTYFTVKE